MKFRILLIANILLISALVYSNGRFPYFGQVRTDIPVALSPVSGTQKINWDRGNIQVVDLGSATGNIRLLYENSFAGAVYVIKIIQGNTARELTFPENTMWTGGEQITLTTDARAIDIVTCLYDGTYYLCTGINDMLEP